MIFIISSLQNLIAKKIDNSDKAWKFLLIVFKNSHEVKHKEHRLIQFPSNNRFVKYFFLQNQEK